MPSKRKSSACVDYVPALCTHRPSLLPIERFSEVLGLFAWRITLPGWREDDQTVAFRGSKSRNKVSVGEPAEGSLSVLERVVFARSDSYPHTVCLRIVSRPGGGPVERMKRRARSGHVRSLVSGYLLVLGATHGDGL